MKTPLQSLQRCFCVHWRKAPSAPPLGELLSECEAEGVRYEIWTPYKIRTTPSQSARSG